MNDYLIMEVQKQFSSIKQCKTGSKPSASKSQQFFIALYFAFTGWRSSTCQMYVWMLLIRFPNIFRCNLSHLSIAI